MDERDPPSPSSNQPTSGRLGAAGEVFAVALGLGLTSFGGPIAHIGYFRAAYVTRLGWLTEPAFAELVSLTQVLPGPSSSQLGIAIGTLRAGRLGGVLAWLGFTLPSVIALLAFAAVASRLDLAGAGWVHGLKLAAVAVVAAAVVAMWRSLAPDLPRSVVAIGAAGVALLLPSGLTQIGLIGVGAVLGWALLRAPAAPIADAGVARNRGRRFALACLALFALILLTLPLARAIVPAHAVALADTFYRAGSIVFGGGHVVLPVLHESVVARAWVTETAFLAGYGAAQAIPGPLFTFAAYLGAVGGPAPNGLIGAGIAVGAIFLPSFLLVWGTLPFVAWLGRVPTLARALVGVHATVLGLLLAALIHPVATSSLGSATDVIVVAAAFLAISTNRAPPWLVVIVSAIAAELLRA